MSAPLGVHDRRIIPPGGGGGGPRIYERVLAAYNSTAAMKALADVVCDGTNDEVEIQAALNVVQVGNGNRGATVCLLPGVYNIDASAPGESSGAVAFNLRGTGTTLCGVNYPGKEVGSTLWANVFNDTGIVGTHIRFRTAGLRVESYGENTFRDLMFNWNPVGYNTAQWVRLATRSLMDRCVVWLGSVTMNVGSTLQNSHIEYLPVVAGTEAVYACVNVTSNHCRVLNNRIFPSEDNTFAGNGAGIRINGGQRAVILGNHIETNMHGILNEGFSGSIIDNIIVRRTSTAGAIGIWSKAGGARSRIRGNHVSMAARTGIQIDASCNDAIIVDNHVVAAAGTQIINNGTGNAVANNISLTT